MADTWSEIAAMPELDFPPGNRFQYSNSNYFLLGEVVHAVTGRRPLPDVVRERIFQPLGLAMQYDLSGSGPRHHRSVVRPRLPAQPGDRRVGAERHPRPRAKKYTATRDNLHVLRTVP